MRAECRRWTPWSLERAALATRAGCDAVALDTLGSAANSPTERSIDIEELGFPAARAGKAGGIVQNEAMRRLSHRLSLPDVAAIGMDEWRDAAIANADSAHFSPNGHRFRTVDLEWLSIELDLLAKDRPSMLVRHVTDEEREREDMSKTIAEQRYALRAYEEEIASLKRTVESVQLASEAARSEVLHSMGAAQRMLNLEPLQTGTSLVDKVSRTLTAAKTIAEYVLFVPEARPERASSWELDTMLLDTTKSYAELHGKTLRIIADAAKNAKMWGDYYECRAALTQTISWWGDRGGPSDPQVLVKDQCFVMRFPASQKDATIDALAHRHSLRLVDAGAEFEIWYPARASTSAASQVKDDPDGRKKEWWD